MAIEHGKYSVTVNENIIIVTLIGSFNEHGTKICIDLIKDKIAAFHGKRFSILMNNLDFLGGTPEAYEVSNQYNGWLNQQNFIAKAIVTTSIPNLAIDHARVPEKKSQNIAVFDNQPDAMAWLTKQL